MLELDGSGGGGQLIRSALSLSALSGRPFRMSGIRDERPNPGLRPQHLAAVRALAAITDASVEGATEGSRTLRFEPSPIQPGRYEVDVGTAGSIALLFDAVLPLATALDDHLALQARGGTDVRWAPTVDYFRRVKLPLLRRHGIAVAVDVERRGFYPAGGGMAALSLSRSTPTQIELASPFPPTSESQAIESRTASPKTTARVFSVATTDLAGREVAERQAETASSGLTDVGVGVVDRVVEYVDARSPGSAVTVRLDRGASILGVDALGERGKPAEEVATAAVDRAREALQSGAAVDAHMADQLLIFLGLVGGRVPIPTVTEHVETSRSLLGRFGYYLTVDESGERPIVQAIGRS